MRRIVQRYTHWLHTRWPAGLVEKLPVAGESGETNIPGLFVCGDLTGIPLLKFSLDSGTRTIRHIIESGLISKSDEQSTGLFDVLIIGAGVSGFAAAAEAKKQGLSYCILESSAPLSTLINFPKRKPIYTYPKEMTPEGDLQVSSDIKEGLIDELNSQIAEHGIETSEAHAERIEREGNHFRVVLTEKDPLLARTVIAALGRSGNHRKLDVPGENLDRVYNRLHDPKDYCGKKALVVGGGDSALETAIALAKCGSGVTLSYRKKEFSRPKPENVEMVMALSENLQAEDRVENPSSERVTSTTGDPLTLGDHQGTLNLAMGTRVESIGQSQVTLLSDQGAREDIENDVVFSMIGREPPLDFFRRSGVRIQGEWGPKNYATMSAFILFCVWMYLWKSGGNPISNFWYDRSWFPFNLSDSFSNLITQPQNLLGTIAISMTQPAFYYGLAYALIVTLFGVLRIKRRKTPYITKQTTTLILIQVIPLFFLPYIVFPWLGHNALLHQGFADTFFPVVDYDPHGREYWRASGFILAWPLFIYNVFSNEPLWGWLIVSFIQTFVLIPLMIYYWGKGAYCGWICSCGALAETLGDTHRTKMPHGPKWNRLNMAGQVILAFAFFLLALRILSWLGVPAVGGVFYALNGTVYKYLVDITLAGIIGVGLYFWFSGRVWCRFFCPLAALMHVYARFSRFRILSEKKKCISCNVCTSVCHQGIDIMNFANKGVPMEDPECVRCSACVQSCPTGVLYFGQVDAEGKEIKTDKTPASPVRTREAV